MSIDKSSLVSTSVSPILTSPSIPTSLPSPLSLEKKESKIKLMINSKWQPYIPIFQDTNHLISLKADIEQCREKIEREQEKAKSVEQQLADLKEKQKELELKLQKIQEVNSVSDYIIIDSHYKK